MQKFPYHLAHHCINSHLYDIVSDFLNLCIIFDRAIPLDGLRHFSSLWCYILYNNHYSRIIISVLLQKLFGFCL